MQPRPDRIEPVVVFVGAPGDSLFASIGMQPAPVAKQLVAAALLGTVISVVV